MSNLFDLTVSRTIQAPPERVFRAFVDPESIEQWFDARQVVMNPEVNGLYFIDARFEGRTWAHYGRYLKVEPPRTLEFTWMSEATLGLDSVVTVELSSAGGKTTDLRLTHSGLPDNEQGRGHEAGWTELLELVANSTEGAKASAPQS